MVGSELANIIGAFFQVRRIFKLGLYLWLAATVPGCGKDPMAGRKVAGGPTTLQDDQKLDADEGRFDRGLVAAYKALQSARLSQNEKAWREGFSGTPDDESMEVYTLTATPVLRRIQNQFQLQDIQGDRATLVVRERIEEKVEGQREMHVTEAILTLTLARAGGSWKAVSVRAEWK